MEELYNVKAVAHDFDLALVECVGGRACLDIEQYCLTEGANIQALKLTLSDPMKDAKNNMKAAKKAAKEHDYARAKQLYKASIQDLEVLKKRAQDIDDDHIVMVAIDAFIKTFIFTFAGTMAGLAIGGTLGMVADLAGFIGGYICGISKTLDYSVAVDKKLTPANKQGRHGTHDPSVWWKAGQTRGAVMTKLDRLITACKKGYDYAEEQSKRH